MTTATSTINLDGIETGDLIAALESRGHTIREKTQASNLETSDLIEALEERGWRVVDQDDIALRAAEVRFDDLLANCDPIEHEQLLAHIRREHGEAVASAVWH
jgi:lambda repressor-like predicted transcriptional regulator